MKHPSAELRPGYDNGPDSPAHRARPAAMHSPEARSRGSVSPGLRTEVVRYADATLYDRMHQRAQISDRQHRAAERIAQMWTSAGMNPRMSATLALRREDEQPFDAPTGRGQADPDAPTARDVYRTFMRCLPAAYAVRIDAMLLDEHPGVRWLATLQSALDWCADAWGYEKNS
jgi:hypothetical protein